MRRDVLLLLLEVAFIVIGVAGVTLLFGNPAGMIVAAVVGVAAVEAKA